MVDSADTTDTDNTNVDSALAGTPMPTIISSPEADSSQSVQVATPPTPTVWDRNSARAAIFAVKPKHLPLTFNGVPVEVRDPSIQDVMDLQSGEDRKLGMALMIINYVYLAGTEDKLFEEGDVSDILALPFNSDVRTLQEAITSLTGVVPSTEDKSQA